MLTGDELEQVRALIARLGYLASREVKARLVAVSDDELDLLARAAVEASSTWIRWNACSVLDQQGDDRQTWALLRAADDPSPKVRQHAVHALSCVTCKREELCIDTVPTLVRALDDSSAKVRRHAAYGLAERRDDPRAQAALTAHASTV